LMVSISLTPLDDEQYAYWRRFLDVVATRSTALVYFCVYCLFGSISESYKGAWFLNLLTALTNYVSRCDKRAVVRDSP
jgi:hypothetical protein